MAVHSRRFRAQCRSHGLDAAARQRLAAGRAAGGRCRRLRRSADRRRRASHRSAADDLAARGHPAIERRRGRCRSRRSRPSPAIPAARMPTRCRSRCRRASRCDRASSARSKAPFHSTALARRCPSRHSPWPRGSIAGTCATGSTRQTSAGRLPAIDPAPFSSPVRVPSTGRATRSRW